jgi:hypothetical protein
VPNNIIKDILNQPNSDERRGKWITKIQEYDLETKLTKLTKRQGLVKLLAEPNCRVLGLNFLSHVSTNLVPELEGKNP